MKNQIAIWTVTVVTAFTLGNIFTFINKSHPTLQMESNLHYCRCVEDHPELYPHFLEAAAEVQNGIHQQTKAFIAAHKLKPTDFQGIFVPQENGNYDVHYFCSHRNRHVTGLQPAFIDYIRPSFEPYRRILRKAHGENF
jgi:hypothetical protein